MSFKLLKNYIQNKMKMSHIYQPVMIKSLINNNGRNNSKNINLVLIKDFGKIKVDFDINSSYLKKYISNNLN